jgi:hypothetical protein
MLNEGRPETNSEEPIEMKVHYGEKQDVKCGKS